MIIGGGFYGTNIAIYLVKQRGLRKVVVLEKESKLLSRASYNNQSRVHNGYHYPRSFTTAFRSRINFLKFVRNWPDAITQDFTKLYAIARRNSKVTARQFKRFCHEIGAKIQPAEASLKKIFEPNLIEDVFLAEEYAFDANRLAFWITKEVQENGIEVRLSSKALSISRSPNNTLIVSTINNNGNNDALQCRYLFNCAYSGLKHICSEFSVTEVGLKQEVTEMALLKVFPPLVNLGITVMDGPFFSLMPFPSKGLHTLSHVRYTPHFSWQDEFGIEPYKKLHEYEKLSRVERMIRDVGRYLPSILNSKYVESLFEIKTVLLKNEVDDGRPILFEKHNDLPGFYSILGGKIDNIYDVLEKLDAENIN
ncbi:Malate:quinone oxidoreductase [Spirobacillus cienkowskii]